ncbi:MAG TPA: SDR family oxidoreductase [Acidimicrobiales bacterium]|nr:SDR family oxidoreductase [Acidimicrobiales bacterium]
MFNAFRYEGKHAVVVGGATGMGAATARLALDAGAQVTVMDRAEITLQGVKAVHIDLADPSSIDAAIDQCGGPIDALFSCAGVADGTAGIEKINFIGHRYMIDKLREKGMLTGGSAIGFISSAAGLGWQANLPQLKEYLDTPDFDSAADWIERHQNDDYMLSAYMWSKQAICAYVARQAFPLLKERIRINAICPGPTDTPLAQANKEMWLGFGSDYREELGINASDPLEQAYPLVFLCSEAASAITGITLIADEGYISSGVTESYPAATAISKFLLGLPG